MKKLIVFSIMALGFGLVSCSPEKKEKVSEPTPVEQTVESTTPKAKSAAPKTESTTPKTESTTPKAEQEASKVDNTQAILLLMQESFSEIGTVHYDEGQKTYIITPTDPGFAQALTYTVASGDTQKWDRLVDSFVKLSADITKKVDSGTSIAIANPSSPDKLILIITDGVVVYDAVSESINQ